VRVKVAACAICHSDILAMDGAWGGSLPAVFGHEAAGVVVETGAAVEGVRPGDHVVVTLVRYCSSCLACRRGEPTLCDKSYARDASPPLSMTERAPIRQGLRTGAFAEEVLVDASQVTRLPPDVPLDRAALLACGVLTGVGAVLNTAKVRPGSRVATIGTGGVGLNCVQGAALAQARTNIAIDLADDKLDAARAFGADRTVNAGREDARAAVLAATEGRGADYVFVAAGSPRAIEQGVTLVRRGGTVVIVGMTAEGVKVSFEAVDLADNAIRILGSKMGAARPQIDLPILADWYRQGRLRLDELISGRFALSDINKAIDQVRQGAALRNVITF
jgi:Zn-dependent alcohol dehydrogenase